MQKKLLHICAAVIVLVAAIDTYWLSKNRLIMEQSEKNPIGRYLLSLDDGDVSLFILFKFIGTYIVLAALYGLLQRHPRKALFMGCLLAFLQICLLLYLYHVPPFIDGIITR